MGKIGIASTPMMHTPGMLEYLKTMYKTGNKKDKQKAVSVTDVGFFRGRDEDFAKKLVSGKVPYQVEGQNNDVISFEYNGEAFKIVQVVVTFRFKENIMDDFAVKSAVEHAVLIELDWALEEAGVTQELDGLPKFGLG